MKLHEINCPSLAIDIHRQITYSPMPKHPGRLVEAKYKSRFIVVKAVFIKQRSGS